MSVLYFINTAAAITGNHHVIKKANESITIHCKVIGGERIIWRQNDKQLNLEETAINNPLQLKKLNRLDKGNFTCETRLKNITARSSILQLDVQGKSKQLYLVVLIIVIINYLKVKNCTVPQQ